MRRTLLVPLAGLALLTLIGLSGCVPTPEAVPTPTATETAAPTESATPTPTPTENPTAIPALPGSALLRVSVTALSGDDEVRLVLTFARASTATTATSAIANLQQTCPNAIASQLESFPGYEPVGLVRATLTSTGRWPEGFTFAVAGGGAIATIGEGDNVAAADDPEGGFGCQVAIVHGPGEAKFTSLMIGDSAASMREALDLAVAHGHYGIESNSGLVTWKDCVVQLSSVAQRYATENNWQLPADFGDGCQVGDAGTV